MHVGRLTFVISAGARRYVRWRLLLALGIICLPLLSTGCICLSFGGWGGGCKEHSEGEHHEPGGAVTQKGNLSIGSGEPVTVYYPVPYASPPNLEVHDPFHKCRIVEQRADCFKIVHDGPALPTVQWTARGVTAPTMTPSANTAIVTMPMPTNEAQPVVPAGFGS